MRHAALLLAVLALACPSLAAQKTPRPVKIQLKAREMPMSEHKSITAGVYFKSAPSKDTPVGFDSLFNAQFGAMTVRILHKGFDKEGFQLFLWPERGNKVEIPRLEKGVSTYYPPFGPLKLRGLPPVTFHFYFPAQGPSFENWKKGSKTLYVLPMECMAGVGDVAGKAMSVALLDRNVNGSCSDSCTAGDRDGDWILLDLDADGVFDMSAMKGEARGLTRCVPIGEFTWSVTCRGKDLYLKPVTLQKFKLRMDGFEEGDVLRGWSSATGSFEGRLDADSCAEIDRDKFAPWSYECVRDAWKIVGSLRVLRTLDPPSGPVRTVEAGPLLKCNLVRNPAPGGDKFIFKCLGRVGDSVTVYKDGKKIEPLFIFKDERGEEVFRKTQGFG